MLTAEVVCIVHNACTMSVCYLAYAYPFIWLRAHVGNNCNKSCNN